MLQSSSLIHSQIAPNVTAIIDYLYDASFAIIVTMITTLHFCTPFGCLHIAKLIYYLCVILFFMLFLLTRPRGSVILVTSLFCYKSSGPNVMNKT